jgi:hypothetical protein
MARKCQVGGSHRREKGRDVTYVVLIIIAVLLVAGLFYLRGRRT